MDTLFSILFRGALLLMALMALSLFGIGFGVVSIQLLEHWPGNEAGAKYVPAYRRGDILCHTVSSDKLVIVDVYGPNAVRLLGAQAYSVRIIGTNKDETYYTDIYQEIKLYEFELQDCDIHKTVAE